MRILHTSDWHIGRLLYGQKRYDEFSTYLDWLSDLIKIEHIDALLVAGDVFDTTTPSNRAQELYYRFLCTVSRSCCRHVVIIAGNHDSPSFLTAPKELLRALNVHVVGSVTGVPEDEVIVLTGPLGVPEAIVCAVPYLRDRDIRVVKTGESIDDKNQRMIKGVQAHYAEVFDIAEKMRERHGPVPIIGMGHLFTAGGRTMTGDGVRELYVGSLAHVGRDIFPKGLDYLALGHLHIPQTVGKCDHIRFSGSPIPMGFGEAKQEKSVVIIDFKFTEGSIQKVPLTITTHPVPCFQPLEKMSGDLDDIIQRIRALISEGSRAWLEIEYTGKKSVGNLREQFESAVEKSHIKICRIRNKQVMDRVLRRTGENETLDDLEVIEVFGRLLKTYDVPEQDRPGLIRMVGEIITALDEEDSHAE